MDSKQIKTVLKNAKELIKNKSFDEAINQCKLVLENDKSNYLAYILMGAAYKELDKLREADASFLAAIKISDDQLLAWQGLATVYERAATDEQKKRQVEVYNKLLSFYINDPDKWLETSRKLTNLLLVLEKFDEFAHCMKQYILKLTDESKLKDAHITIVKNLSQTKQLSADQKILLEESAKIVITYELNQPEITEKAYKECILLLLDKENYTEALQFSNKMKTLFPKSIFSLEILCRIYIEDKLKDSTIEISKEDLLNVSDDLEKLNVKEGWINFAHGAFADLSGELDKAATHYQNGLKKLTQYPACWLITLQCLHRLHRSHELEVYSQQGLKVSRQNNKDAKWRDLEMQLHIYYVTSVVDIGEINQLPNVVKMVGEILSPCEDLLVQLALAHIKLQDNESALKISENSILSEHSKLWLKSLIYISNGNFEEALKCLNEAVGINPNSGAYFLEIGKVYEHLNKAQNALPFFLKAAKADQYNCKAFYHLGLYYMNTLHDVQKARRCFQKANTLNPSDGEIGAVLSDAYQELGEEDLNFKLLTSFTKDAQLISCKWAWLRLGLYNLRHDKPDAAVVTLQYALRMDPLDSHCWECLAEAYVARGSYTSAIKAFGKALELDPSSLFCRYQIASIKLSLGLDSEAISEFEEILKISESYVPALKGLAEANISSAKTYLSKSLTSLAIDCCQIAIALLYKALSSGPQLVCIWKLLGDACIIIPTTVQRKFSLSVPAVLTGDKDIIGRQEAIALAVRCYGQALSLQPECASLWHDIGVAYFQLANCQKPENKDELENKARLALSKAVAIEPTNAQHWLVLGFVAASSSQPNYQLAQHSFIMSIKVDPNNVESWTNLGVLYLLNDNINLAHQAFNVAQSIEPTFIQCWIGQAMIAENVAHADTMDLYRHTTSLGIQDESCLGYGEWVCRTLLDEAKKNTEQYQFTIERMHAVPVGIDCLSFYTDHVEDDARAFNTYGILLERQGLYSMASKAFSKAIQLLDKSDKELDMARANFSRTLCQQGKWDLAAAEFQKIKEADLSTQSGLGLAYYLAGKYVESYEAYEAACSWCATNDEEKVQVLIALACVALKCYGAAAAKEILFRSAQIQSATTECLITMASLGITQSDTTLVLAALEELKVSSFNLNHTGNVALLNLGLNVLQNELTLGKNSLCKSIHVIPHCPMLWKILAKFLVEFGSSGANASARCAIISTRHQTDLEGLLLVCVALLLSGKIKESLREAQKAVRLYPNSPETWAILVACMYANGQKDPKKFLSGRLEWLQNLLTQILHSDKFKKSKQSDKLIAWLLGYLFLVAVQHENWDSAKQCVTNMLQSGVGDSSTVQLCNVLAAVLYCAAEANNGSVSEGFLNQLQDSVTEHPEFAFGWQCLLRFASDKSRVLTHWENSVNDFSASIQLLCYLHQACHEFSSGKDNPGDKKWRRAVYLNSGKALSTSKQCASARFLFAIGQFAQGNKNGGKKELRRILNSDNDTGFGWVRAVARDWYDKLQEPKDESL